MCTQVSSPWSLVIFQVMRRTCYRPFQGNSRAVFFLTDFKPEKRKKIENISLKRSSQTFKDSKNIWPKSYFGHLIPRAGSLEKTLILGKTGQDENGATEVEMVGFHHWLSGHEFKQTLGDSEGQRSLACCSTWGRKESDTAEQQQQKNLGSSPAYRYVTKPWSLVGLEFNICVSENIISFSMIILLL